MQRYIGAILQVTPNVAGSTERGQRQKSPVRLLRVGFLIFAFASFLVAFGARANADIECTSDSKEVKGTNGDDVIDCDETGPHTVKGRAGDDEIFTGSDDDRIDGGPGDDDITDAGGNNKINAGEGDDTVTFNSTGADKNDVQGGKGNDIITDLCSGAECGKDRLRGGEGDDIIDGGDNDDLITGDDGDDTLSGHAGDDCIDGGDGEDYCDGGDGDDCCRDCETEISCDPPGVGVCVGDLLKRCKFPSEE
jgi:Ca2+-binding RTX toxin-like protein